MKRRVVVISLIVVALIAGSVALYQHNLNERRQLYGPGGGYRCGTHLKQVGLALLLYGRAHQGRYPNALGDLVASADVPPSVLTCPFAPSLGTDAFVFVAAGRMAEEIGSDEIVAHEPIGNHNGAGAMALFGDGHIKWMTPTELRQQLAFRPTSRGSSSTAPANSEHPGS
jgi:prepilin-type processing-associated H-X9-DG protein